MRGIIKARGIPLLLCTRRPIRGTTGRRRFLSSRCRARTTVMHIISEGDVIAGHPLASRRVLTFPESTYSYPPDVYKSINDPRWTSDRRPIRCENCRFAARHRIIERVFTRRQQFRWQLYHRKYITYITVSQCRETGYAHQSMIELFISAVMLIPDTVSDSGYPLLLR